MFSRGLKISHESCYFSLMINPLQVVKKRRASRLENMKAKISGGRGNKVAPLLFDNSNSTATNPAANQDERPLSRSTINMPYQAQVPADESSASSDWNSMFGAI